MKKILFVHGYAGAVKCEVYVDDVLHVIELEHVRDILLKAMDEKGYTVTQEARQKHPRLTIKL